ncbi:MAG: hypothetical protein NC342_04425 [Pseudoflavonifractor sp.]|nr:hypothetical protein [Alloprevotella sp.]MCM1116763.1 hypothetical protein [Pseudoflavonifractor sp.]
MKINPFTGALLTTVIASAAILSSCGSDDPDNPDRGEAVKVSSPKGFTFVAPDNLPLLGISSASTAYDIDFYADNTADILISGLSLAQGSQPTKIELTGVKYRRVSNGAYYIDARNISTNGGIVKLAELNLIYNAAPQGNPQGSTLFAFAAETSDGMNITFIPDAAVAFGSTTITTPGSPDFTSTSTTYEIVMKEGSGKADVIVHEPKFSSQMPAVGDMLFPDIDVTFDDKGGFNLYSPSFVPSISGVPYPSFTITNFYAEVDLDSEADIDISFQCSPFGQTYNVKASDLSYYCK